VIGEGYCAVEEAGTQVEKLDFLFWIQDRPCSSFASDDEHLRLNREGRIQQVSRTGFSKSKQVKAN
jgi:hypothetical protein